jgi:flavorubredoxin
MDTVDAAFGEEWLKNIEDTLGGRKPDYLVVQHMEPDHSANIERFTRVYPEAKIVASQKAFVMMRGFFGTDFADRQIVVGEGSTLELGARTLTFVTAPMVHWPEVIVTYDSLDKVLFSADGFGRFGDTCESTPWADESRRYFIGIVGKYGAQVQALLKKAAGLDIAKIAPLHGPVLTENLGYYLNLYDIWSSYGVESEGIVINYTSVYGNTKAAVEKLAQMLRDKGCEKVVVNDLARSDMWECVEDSFRYGKMVLATTTYMNDIFPYMKELINSLVERGYTKRTIGLIENGTWAPVAAKTMRAMFDGCKDLTFTDTTVTIKSSLDEASEAQLAALADELMK